MPKKQAVQEGKVPHEKFLEEWVKNGFDSKKAYQKLCPNVTPDSAKTLGSRLMGQIKSTDVYRSLLDKAYNTVSNKMSSKDEKIALKAAQDLLDRANGKAQQSLDVTTQGKPLGILLDE